MWTKVGNKYSRPSEEYVLMDVRPQRTHSANGAELGSRGHRKGQVVSR